ncbi:adenine deaminase [Paenibacillus alvei]|uniref:Adenine deaminase n=1 Tax=Paenibacillus alvei TaxID=44250 RepID=A0ABT4GVW8_PAEAL|nr:adenine deaminase [Paenibacillus alvei]EJW15280.1 adenine deaminase Ade [Paenibacillus alvei DSM 29]MCY9544161.1 adenine deaminase [Paenibacillus alvei]MCY9702928.1 adenine deaminase [Paenibacillus alvei]MCY9733243.1 adenine deaminase [Paenibacillus alvei]MCY9754110.1 adenine deaminase [Paenibacillus alvei]
MNWSKQHWINRIAAAGRRKPADLVITNGKIVDVFNLEIMEGDIAIVDGMIVGIGGSYEGERVIDAEGRYIAPSFIDTHVHIESAMVTPAEFARVVLPHGVTTVITDPHEIANVVGTAGIQYMLDASENLPLDVYIMLPSCVPCTPFEHAGAKLDAGSLEPFYAHPRVLGLAEVMDYPSVRRGDDDMVDKLLSSHRNGRMIDGHGAGLDEEAINVYRAVGIRNDHECVTAEEARVRLRRGMYVMLREGSVAKDVEALIPAVTASNARRCVFCTDDKHLDELLHEGSVDHNARLAIRCGLDPLQAIQMASLNAAECFGLHTKGAIAPGYEADFLLLDNLHDLTIAQVYKAGNRVGDNGQYTGPQLHSAVIPSQLMKTVHLPDITERDLQIELGNQERHCHIIGINPNSLITTHLVEAVDIENGYFRSSVEKDQLKIAVFERHHHTGCVGLGIVKGFGIQSGAIASTVAHDSHNLVVAGSNDRDMLTAIQALRQMEGGLVVTSGGKVLAAIELPLAGLMAINGYTKVLEDMEQLNEALARIGASQEFNPFVTLSFLCLPVIPELKLTDMGLFDFSSFTHIPVSAK